MPVCKLKRSRNCVRVFYLGHLQKWACKRRGIMHIQSKGHVPFRFLIIAGTELIMPQSQWLLVKFTFWNQNVYFNLYDLCRSDEFLRVGGWGNLEYWINAGLTIFWNRDIILIMYVPVPVHNLKVYDGIWRHCSNYYSET